MMRVLMWAILMMSAIVLAWAGHRWAMARTEANIAIRQLALVSADVKEIAGIKASSPPESRRSRPAPGLATRVADVVSKAGLPQAALQNLSPETESAAGAGLRKQAAKIMMDGMTLPELGRFLNEWRNAQPLWTVSSIDITPTPTPAKTRQASGPTDRPLRAVLGIETIFSATTPEWSR
jgi:hypothetical protein